MKSEIALYESSDAEGTAATASALDVWVVELEPRTLEGLNIINLDAFEIHLTHLVYEDFQAFKFVDVVGLIDLILKGHVIGEARAAATDDRDAERCWRWILLRHDFPYLRARDRRNADHEVLSTPLAVIPTQIPQSV